MSRTPGELTYPLRAAARLTGLTPDLLRAWERRYGVVEPLRTPGGTRRYRSSDLERLKLVKTAVDAGHRIGRVARMELEELRRCAAGDRPPAPGLEPVLQALGRLDGAEAERLLSGQLAALGPTRFARDFALPLIREVGDRWAAERLCVASEHLGSGLLRALMGSALRPGATSLLGPRIVFGTPDGERHELGLLVAALVAMGAGANPLYLGPELPVGELCDAVTRSGAAALALSLVVLPAEDAARILRDLRSRLPEGVPLWVGGARAERMELPEGVERLASFDALEQRVALLELARPA